MTDSPSAPTSQETPMIRVVSGYPRSRDYAALARAMREHSLICLVPYQGNANVMDVTHTRYRRTHEGVEQFTVGARGIVYLDAEGEAEFLSTCEKEGLEFLLPQTDVAARIEELEAEIARLRALTSQSA